MPEADNRSLTSGNLLDRGSQRFHLDVIRADSNDVTPGSAPTPPPASGAQTRRRRIGEVLVEQRVITEDQLRQALEQQTAANGVRRKIGQLVVSNGWASEHQVASALASALALPLIELGKTPLDMEAGRLLPRSVADRQGVLVLSRDQANPHRLHVAVVDPTNVFALDDVKMYTGAQDLTVAVAVESELRAALATVWSLAEENAAAALLDGLN